MSGFRLNIPDPLADERRLLGNALTDVYKSVIYDLNERHPGSECAEVVRDSVETAMLSTLAVLDGHGSESTYVVLPYDLVEPLSGVDEVPTLAGSLVATLRRDFARINN